MLPREVNKYVHTHTYTHMHAHISENNFSNPVHMSLTSYGCTPGFKPQVLLTHIWERIVEVTFFEFQKCLHFVSSQWEITEPMYKWTKLLFNVLTHTRTHARTHTHNVHTFMAYPEILFILVCPPGHGTLGIKLEAYNQGQYWGPERVWCMYCVKRMQ